MFLIIVIIVISVLLTMVPNQKTQKEIDQTIKRLPNIYLQSRGMSGLVRTLNLAFDDSAILQYFAYESGVVTLTMKDGETLKTPLSQMEVTFSTYNAVIQMDIIACERLLKVIAFDNFNVHEWNVIIRTMALAGKTYCTHNLTVNVDDTQRNIREILKELRYIS